MQPAGVGVRPWVIRMHLGVRGTVCTGMCSGVLVHVCVCACTCTHSPVCVFTHMPAHGCTLPVCPALCSEQCLLLCPCSTRLPATPRKSLVVSQSLQSRVGREDSGGAPWGWALCGHLAWHSKFQRERSADPPFPYRTRTTSPEGWGVAVRGREILWALGVEQPRPCLPHSSIHKMDGFPPAVQQKV